MRASDSQPTGPQSPAGLPPVVIVAYPDGPLLVRGAVRIITASGQQVPRRRATVALCRCGASGIKPYCDGSHKAIDFRTDDDTVTPHRVDPETLEGI